MRCSVFIVCPSVLSCSNLKLHQILEVKKILIQENIMLQLQFNPGLGLTGFRTNRPKSFYCSWIDRTYASNSDSFMTAGTQRRWPAPLFNLYFDSFLLRSAHTMGLVSATSPCNKSQGLIASCELATFATKSSRRDQILVPATSTTNSNWFEFVGLVAGTKVGPCDWILKQKWPVHTMRLVSATSRRD